MCVCRVSAQTERMLEIAHREAENLRAENQRLKLALSARIFGPQRAEPPLARAVSADEPSVHARLLAAAAPAAPSFVGAVPAERASSMEGPSGRVTPVR